MKQKLMITDCAAIVLGIVLSCSQGESVRPVLATAPAVGVNDLKSLDQLKDAFQRDRGTVRSSPCFPLSDRNTVGGSQTCKSSSKTFRMTGSRSTLSGCRCSLAIQESGQKLAPLNSATNG